MTSTATTNDAGRPESGRRYWFGRRVAVLGAPAEGSRKALMELLRGQGAVVQRRANSRTELIVLAGNRHGSDLAQVAEQLEPWAAAALRDGRIDVIDETEARRRAADQCDPAEVQRLYTPTMLARMVGAEAWTIRRWARRGWLRPVRQVRHVYYFDRDAAQAAQRLADLSAEGLSPQALKRQLELLRRRFPEAGDPLHGPNWSVQGRWVVYQGPIGPAQADGQRLFGFAPPADAPPEHRRDDRGPARRGSAGKLEPSVRPALGAERPTGDSRGSNACEGETDAAAAGASAAGAIAPAGRTRWLFVAEVGDEVGDLPGRAGAAASDSSPAVAAKRPTDAEAIESFAAGQRRPLSEEDAEETTGKKHAEEATPRKMARTVAELLSGRTVALPTHAGHLIHLASELEDDGQWAAAAEMYRAAMAAGGPTAELCFQTAELLYRMEDLAGARERYYMALELDEEFVEARLSLGCVLIELNQLDLAEAAFRGTLRYHPHFADGHYFLARLLDKRGAAAEAERHWRAFLDLAPDSPWADEALQRLSQ